ncbi:MAG: preprotein translocase subunit SecE [Actinomyces urogenitalis]|uniref:Protein translocase subunit SecE n=1 Tax=Actinomyces urogenitalis DORA_12 TaxID=1403939 RepID=W1VNC4_9ACTO|nr:preprotein translocase subunit SecE [Actinomyces urogenitalis]ETJ07528.1 MAG: Preprotein translocase SecE [Actinomyces urogenitalis DORA_12]MDU0972142.1 preprotein translocase subunit SecE [Actinomyces urogenitalis]MDU5427109.1 preprotein translocase subunit SecE [Actinomyces urogenitalis]MDU7428584.1 preprotein translocase subunit SecE [Actinomyces urogenitalis]
MSEGTTVAKGAQPKKIKGGPLGRLALFFRQVIDELRKVVWPTRKELWTYFLVVVVFIVAIMAYTGILDFIFDRIVMWVFA